MASRRGHRNNTGSSLRSHSVSRSRTRITQIWWQPHANSRRELFSFSSPSGSEFSCFIVERGERGTYLPRRFPLGVEISRNDLRLSRDQPHVRSISRESYPADRLPMVISLFREKRVETSWFVLVKFLWSTSFEDRELFNLSIDAVESEIVEREKYRVVECENVDDII